MKKLIKKLLIFLSIFIVLSLLITYLSILNTKNKNTTEKGIDLYGTYDQNDVLINELVESYNGIEIKLPKLEGLKDTNIQEKINQDMYNRAHEILKEYSAINYANFYTRANFANVISIGFHVGNNDKNNQLYLNYNLINGDRLKLEDLFIKGTDITSIIRSAFYKLDARNKQYDSENNIISPNENEVYKAVRGYIKSDKEFAFSPSEICFYYNQDVASIKMVDIYDKVSIYTKYLTDESIYTRNDIGYKNIFTCANGSYDIFEKIEYGYLEDNFWYDITTWPSYESEEVGAERLNKFNNFKNTIYKEIDEKVDEYRVIARNNPDKFYILFSKPNINIYSDSKYENGKWSYTYSNLANVNKNIQIFEMPLEVYEKIYKDKLVDTYRYVYFEMRGGAYLDTEADDGAIVTKLDEEKLYNYITGKEVKNIDEEENIW